MGRSPNRRAHRVLLCSTVLTLLTLVLGYFIAESFLVALLTSFVVAYIIVRTRLRYSEGSVDVFVDLALSVLLGVFIYLTVYYVVAGAYVGPRLGLSPLDYLLLMVRSSMFLTHYIMYTLMYLIVGSLLVFFLAAFLYRR